MAGNSPPSAQRHGLVRALIAVVLIGWVVHLLVGQWHEVRGAVRSLAPGWIASATVLLLVYYLLIAENWRAIMGALGASLGRGQAFRILYLSNLAKFLPGGVWNLFGRVALCKTEGIALSAATMSLVIELVASCGAMAVVALITLGTAAQALVPIGRSVLIAGVILVVLGTHPRVVNGILRLARRLTKRELPLLEVSYGFVLALLARYLVAWVLVAESFVLFAQALVTDRIGLDDTLFIWGSLSIAWLVSLFAFIVPAGLGVREVLLSTLLSLRWPAPIAAALTLGFRIALVLLETLAFGIAAGMRKRDEPVAVIEPKSS